MKIAFVTNFCPHYRIKTFETLAKYFDVSYYFFSAGDDWYWQQQNGVQTGDFQYEYLPGFRLGRSRITPTLSQKLWSGTYDVYIKCINGRFALPIAFAIARLKRRPFVLWTGIWMRLQTPTHRLVFPLTRYIYRHADAIIVYGEHVKRYLISEGVLSERIFVTTHAVDNEVYRRTVSPEEKASLREKLGIAPEEKVVLYLGRLVNGKGLDNLIEAFSSLQRDDAILVMVGSGSEKASLEAMVDQARIASKVRFIDHLPHDETVLYYGIAWVYVLPSVTTPVFKEPWGLVVNEAFNQGVPVIATDAVGAAGGGLVQDGVNGFVVPERNCTALAQALQRILDDPNRRETMSQNAREAIAGWDNERMVQGFRQAIEYVSTKNV